MWLTCSRRPKYAHPSKRLAAKPALRTSAASNATLAPPCLQHEEQFFRLSLHEGADAETGGAAVSAELGRALSVADRVQSWAERTASAFGGRE